MQEPQECKLLCEVDDIPAQDAQFINERIKEGYAFNWAVDGLPAATEDIDVHTNEKYYNIGFKMGSVEGETAFLNNHYDIKIHYHTTSRGLSRVVGVSVDPYSRNTPSSHRCSDGLDKFHLSEDGKGRVVYTYSVQWIVSSLSSIRAILRLMCPLLAFGYSMGYTLGWLSPCA